MGCELGLMSEDNESGRIDLYDRIAKLTHNAVDTMAHKKSRWIDR